MLLVNLAPTHYLSYNLDGKWLSSKLTNKTIFHYRLQLIMQSQKLLVHQSPLVELNLLSHSHKYQNQLLMSIIKWGRVLMTTSTLCLWFAGEREYEPWKNLVLFATDCQYLSLIKYFQIRISWHFFVIRTTLWTTF